VSDGILKNMEATIKNDNSEFKRPKILLVVGIFFLVSALFVSAELLSSIGIMRKSLTSDDQAVQRIAYLTVNAFKIACLIMFVKMMLVFLLWKKFLSLKTIQKITHHKPFEHYELSYRTQFLNGATIVMISIILLCIIFVALSGQYFNESVLLWIAKEDGFIEQYTAVNFLIASLISAIIAKKERVRGWRITYTVFAVGFFLCFGEEISWGQRIIGFQTPEIYQNINVQKEFNMHNIGGYFSDHLFILGVFIYGFVFPLLTWTSSFWLKLFDKIYLPIATLNLAVYFLIISTFHDWTLYRIFPLSIVPIAEMRELLTSIGFLLLMIGKINVKKIKNQHFTLRQRAC
jgi:hypothetical protein